MQSDQTMSPTISPQASRGTTDESSTGWHPAHEQPDTSESKVKSIAKGLGSTLLAVPFAITAQHGLAGPTCRHGYHEVRVSSGYYQRTSLESIRGYDFVESQVSEIKEYFTKHPMAYVFVSKMRTILDKVYGTEGTRKEIKILEDYETGQPLMQLVFWSGLPLDEEFVEKDHEVFDELEREHLADGLQHVVFSNS